MQELTAASTHEQSCCFWGRYPVSSCSLPLYSVLDLWRVGCHQMRTCTGMGQIEAPRAACTQAAMTKNNNACLGPRKRPKV